LATLLAGVPKDFRLGALITSKDLQEKDKEDLLAMSHSESWRKKSAHLLD
jgi:hypothetical protein